MKQSISISLSLSLSLLCLLAPGCATQDDGDEPQEHVSQLVDQEVDELQSQVDVICDCWNDWGLESRSSCEVDALAIGPSQVRCMKNAYAQDPEISIDYLECIVPLEREYTTCINQRLECYDVDSADPCYDDYLVGLDDCIGLPTNITRDLDACFE